MNIPSAILEPFYAYVRPTLSQIFIFSVSLTLQFLFGFPILEIFYALLLGYIVYTVMIYIIFQSLEDKYKWVRREWRLLKALIKDVECVSKSVDETGNKALELWDSELSPGVILRLDQAEKAWVETIKKVVRDAESCVISYQRLRERREFPTWSYSNFCAWVDIVNLDFEIDRVKDGINLIMNREESFENICGSLERSRSIVRSLQDRPIVEGESFVYKRVGPSPSSSSNVLIKKIPDLVLLKLLLAFLRDLEGLRLESEIENAWVKEAEVIIDELQHDIDLVLGVEEEKESVNETEQARVKEAVEIIVAQQGIDDNDIIQTLVNPRSWFSYFNNLMARRQLRKSCNCIETLLRDLFERKVMFGFTFIRRHPSKSLRQSPQQQNDDVGIIALVDNIGKQLNQEPAMVCYHLTQLKNQFEKVHKLLMDAKAVEGMKDSRIAWTDQLKDIVKDAENSLRAYRQSSSYQKSKRQKETQHGLKFSAEVRRFEHALSLLELSAKVCCTELREEINFVVGLEDDVHKVVSQLTTNSEHFSILSIVGMKGIGKTTLAKRIYDHGAIRGHFNYCAWASLPDMVANDDVLKIVGNQVLTTHEERNEREYWIMKVSNFLMNVNYLLVLDNITTKEVWDSLKEAFPETTNGSRILLTTRYKSVASHADQSSVPHQLRLRTKDESWRLFTQMVDFQLELSQPELSPTEISKEAELEEVKARANKVVGRCWGLPLSILRLGYLLSGKKVTLEELSIALGHINRIQTPWLETFVINVEDLPLHLRQCLSYFAHLPEDFEIPARRLAALLVEEGLVEQRDDEREPLEYVAEKYFSELMDRNLMQVVEQKLDGKLKTCGFPSALRELWSEYESNTVPTCSPSSRLNEPLVCHFNESDACYMDSRGTNIISPDIWTNYKNLGTFLFCDTGKRYNSGEKIGIILGRGIASRHLLKLKVLDLEHVFRPQLPRNIRRLSCLRYLGLRWTYLETIPSSIGNLVNLQTLDLKHTYIRILPRSIRKLKKLQHLYLSEIHRGKIVHRPRQNFLQNLRTLQNVYVDEQSLRERGLHNLINLRKLKMAFELEQSQQDELLKRLVKLTHLVTLKLKSIDAMGKPQSLVVNQFSKLQNLSSLYLFGKLEYPPTIININELPQSLTKLTLSASGLLDDPMKELEKLYNLESLSFYSHSYTGKSMICSNGGFPQLLVLKFWMLCELEEWNVAEQAMPNLKQLEIRSCQKLEVPKGLRHLKSLRELKLNDMPEKFSAKIEEDKEKIWGVVAYYPAIIVGVHVMTPAPMADKVNGDQALVEETGAEERGEEGISIVIYEAENTDEAAASTT